MYYTYHPSFLVNCKMSHYQPHALKEHRIQKKTHIFILNVLENNI